MFCLSKIVLVGQVHLTAIMTLIAGLPYYVCACSWESNRKDLAQPTIQMAECHCCGSCGSNSGANPFSAGGIRSCCSSGTISQKNQSKDSSPQARGNGCKKVVALPKIPGVISTKTSMQIKVLAGSGVLSPATLVTAMQICPQGTGARWTGHAPAPPSDLVASLQRLLI